MTTSTRRKPIGMGGKAPVFTIPGHTGTIVNIDARRGRPVVLYSDPRESSATCTVEARCFRHSYHTFTDADGDMARDVLPQPTTETPLEAA